MSARDDHPILANIASSAGWAVMRLEARAALDRIDALEAELAVKRPLAAIGQLAPAERMALTVAVAQVERYESPPPNTAFVVVMALKRITDALTALAAGVSTEPEGQQ